MAQKSFVDFAWKGLILIAVIGFVVTHLSNLLNEEEEDEGEWPS